MSKKKGSGNTMTLKDFHGGSIPNDLPLPSAPGVYVSINLDYYYFRFIAFTIPFTLILVLCEVVFI